MDVRFALAADADPILMDESARLPSYTPECFQRLNFAESQDGGPEPAAQKRESHYVADFFANLNDMRKSETFCDVYIRVNHTDIPAHRIVLAASSSYFKRYFNEHPKSSNSDSGDPNYRCFLSHSEPELVKALVEFAYSRKLTMTASTAFELYRHASNLEMADAQDKICAFLVESLQDSNAYARLNFACLNGARELREACIRYLSADFYHTAFATGFFKLDYDTVHDMLASSLTGSVGEDQALDALVNWVDSNPSTRMIFLEDLFDLVQIPFLSSAAINDVLTQPNGTIVRNKHCREKLNNAYGAGKFVDSIGKMVPRGGFIYAVGRPSCHFEHFFEVFDPAANAWRLGPKIANYQFGAEIRICSLGSSIYTIGDRYIRPSPTSMIFDLTTEQWEEMPSPNPARIGISVCSIPHMQSIVVMGGFTAADWATGSSNSVQMYRKSTAAWELLPPMLKSRKYCTSAVVGDKVFAIGGLGGNNALNSVEYFSLGKYIQSQSSDDEVSVDPKTLWEPLSPMNQYRYLTDAVLAGDRLYVAGGREFLRDDPPAPGLRSIEFYDFDRMKWYEGPPMLHQRAGCALVASGGALYAIGGFDTHETSDLLHASVERLDQRSGKWHPIASLTQAKGNVVATCVSPL